MHAILVCVNFWISDSDLRLVVRPFRGRMVKKNSVVNMSCIHAADHGRLWVLSLLDVMLGCSKSTFIDPLLLALW